jgi:hypothetical protein
MSLQELKEFAAGAARVLGIIGVHEAPAVPMRLGIHTSRFTSAQDAASALEKLPARGGWSQQPARLRVFAAGPVVPAREDGALLYAEAFAADVGWSLRHLGGAWQLTEITDSTTGDVPGMDCLALDETLLATPHLPDGANLAALQYRVYWQRDEETGWRPFAARLLEFKSGKNEGQKQ